MVGFIDDHRAEYGVEPICSVLPIAPSTYHEQKAQQADLSRMSDRALCDLALREDTAATQDGLGITPTLPVEPTIAGVEAGRDEQLERALEYVRGPLPSG